MSIGRTNTGGAGLNISIVRGSKPTAPKENTIFVNSSYSMHAWAISPTEPYRVSKNQNLIVYPFLDTTNTVKGVTFTDDKNNKGTVIVNGTNTSSSNAVFYVSHKGIENRELLLQPGKYYLSGTPSDGSDATHCLVMAYSYDNWGKEDSIVETGSGRSFTLTKIAKVRLAIRVKPGATITNAVYKPQIEKGSAFTSFAMGNATGQVWVKTSEFGYSNMNALKTNAIDILPVSVYEYVTNDGWYERSAEIYQYGTWSVVKPLLYIYNNGKSTGYSWKCDTTMKQTSAGYDSSPERVTINETDVTVTTNSRSYDFTNIFVANSSDSIVDVDLSAYTKIRIKGTLAGVINNTDCVFRVLSAMGDLATSNNVISKPLTSGTIDETIDISAVNSSCYIGFTFYNSTTIGNVITFKISELWLE